MTDSNGKSFKIVMYLISVIVLILISIVTFIGRSVIANDEKSQKGRKEITEKIYLVEKENGKRFEEIMIALTDLKTEQRVVANLIKRVS